MARPGLRVGLSDEMRPTKKGGRSRPSSSRCEPGRAGQPSAPYMWFSSVVLASERMWGAETTGGGGGGAAAAQAASDMARSASAA